MLGECFANPIVLAILCANEDDETISGSIVGVKEVGDDFKESESTGENSEEIFRAEEVIEVLLELLGLSSGL